MKRLLFIILLFGVCLTFNRAHAQRCLPGMRGIQAHGRAVGQHALEKRRRLRLPRRDSGEHLHEERPPLGGRCGILGEAVRLPGLPLSGEPVHGRGRLLPELPFRPEEDILRRTGAVRPCRVRDGELGREPAAGRLPAHG